MQTHPEITIKFTWSPEDYREYLDLQRKLYLPRDWASILFYASATLGVIWLIVVGNNGSNMILAVAGALLLIWLLFVHAPQMKRRFSQLRLGEHENQLVISEAGVSYDAVTCRSEFDWDMFRTYSENDSHSVLWINRWQGICIPKRAFANDADLAAFEELARAKTAGKTLA